MKKRGKKRIGILIILILVTILGIKLFKNSKANKSIELVATIVDENDFLENEEYIIQASSEDESGYCIILPNVINEKVVSQYYVSEKNINENITKDSNKDIKIVEKLPNEKLYLTEEEVQSRILSANLLYGCLAIPLFRFHRWLSYFMDAAGLSRTAVVFWKTI